MMGERGLMRKVGGGLMTHYSRGRSHFPVQSYSRGWAYSRVPPLSRPPSRRVELLRPEPCAQKSTCKILLRTRSTSPQNPARLARRVDHLHHACASKRARRREMQFVLHISSSTRSTAPPPRARTRFGRIPPLPHPPPLLPFLSPESTARRSAQNAPPSLHIHITTYIRSSYIPKICHNFRP